MKQLSTAIREKKGGKKLRPPLSDKINLISVVGCGRSGSTLLDSVLGAHPEVVSMGEVWYYEPWMRKNFKCSCGVAVGDCEFWQKVATRLHQAEPPVKLAIAPSLGARIRTAWTILSSAKPQVIAKGYAESHARLFEAIQTISQKSLLLDVSKHPFRVYSFLTSGRFDLKVIHLIRDGRGYVHSKSKAVTAPAKGQQGRPPTSIWRASWHWYYTNFFCERLSKYLPEDRFCRIRYEDFVRAPEATTWQLCEFLRIEYSPRLLAGNPMRHNISGSRWRFQPQSEFRLDEKWRTELPRARRLIFNLMCGRLNRKYGYDL